MGDDEDAWRKLPTEEKIQHKMWKARMDGYEQLKKMFEQADEKSPEFSKYQHYMKNLAVDANAFAQEKGLEVIAIFVENAACAGKTASEVVSGVVTKGLGARPKAKEKSVEILLMYIEIDKQEIVIEELCKSFSHKTPKNVVAAVATVREALTAYGNKVVGIKPLLKIMPALFLHKDKTVREEAKLLSIEMYKWVNLAVKQALSGIPPVALRELEEEWGKLGTGAPPLPTRFLRSAADYRAKIEAQAAKQSGASASADGSGPAAPAEVVDPYEFMEPVEILSQVPADFLTQLEEKKWSIRKDALTKFKELAAAPKLQPGDYGDIVRAMKKIIAKDTNVMVVIVAAECVSALANGLRKKFSTYSSFVFGAILERFREKKQTVVESLRAAGDAVIKSNKLETFVEDFLEHCESKSPNVKTETLLVFKRYILSSAKPSEVPKALIKQLMPVLKKRMDESQPEIRDACYELIASIWKLVGEKNIMPFISDVDKLKLDKIKETHEKLVAKPAEGDSGAKPAEAKPEPAPKAAAPPAAAGAGKPGAPGSARGGPGKGGAKGGDAGGGKKKPAAKESPKEVIERELDDGAVEVIREEHFNEDIRKKMDSMNWKERQEAMEEVKKKLALMEPEKLPCQAFVRIIGCKNNFKETNFNVMILKFNLLAEVARLGKFSKTSFQICAQPIVDKIGDIKSGSSAKNALTEIAEKVGFPIVAEDVLTLSMAQKNPKNQSEGFNWVSENIKLFGFKGLTPKGMVEKIKTCLLASNPQIRQSAVTLAGVMHIYMGPQIRALFESEKAATLQMIDAEFEKVKDIKPDPPTRGVKSAAGPGGDADGSGQPAEEEEPEDLMPRSDISAKVSEELLEKLADSKWKIREEGLQNVQALIKEAAFITPNLGELPAALCKRLADSNKLLVSSTASICEELATALGPKGCKQHFKTFAAALFNSLSDSKPSVRQACSKCLDTWAENAPLALIFEDEIALTALKSNNVNLRMGLLSWLEKQMNLCKPLPPADLVPCLTPVFTSLEDRNGDVRKAAQGACLMFLAHLGYDKVFRQTSKLSPTSQQAIGKILEGMRPNIPDVKSKFKPPAPVAAAAPPPPVEEAPANESPKSAKSRPAGKSSATSKAPEPSSPAVSDTEPEPAAPESSKKPAGKGPGPKGTKATSARSRQSTAVGKSKQAEEEDLSPPLIKGKGKESKEQRLKDENGHKVLRWNFTAPAKEHITQLNEQMAPVCSKSMHGLLFHADFKYHLQAMQILTDFCQPENEDVLCSNVDVILKWVSLRLFDTNTTVILKVLDLTLAVFTQCSNQSLMLTDLEAQSFFPYMIMQRIGDPKEEIRKKVQALIKFSHCLYPAIKIFAFLMDGTKQKNARGRSECLEAMTYLVEELGLMICHPTQAKAVKEIAAIIGDKDNTVRNSALGFLTLAVSLVGEDQTKKWVGTLPEKQQSMLDERIKRSLKGNANHNVTVEPVQDKLVGMNQVKGIKPLAGGAKAGFLSARQGNAGVSQSVRANTVQELLQDEDNELNRPQTAPANESHQAQPLNPNNKLINFKYFKMDFDEIERNRKALPPMPKLYSNPEVEALLKEPIPNYTVKSRKSDHAKLSMLTGSNEVSETLGVILSSVTDSDLAKSSESLSQIASLLRDQERNVLFQEQDVQKLVASTTLQLKMCITHHLILTMHQPEKLDKCRKLILLMIDVLLRLFQVSRLAHMVPSNELCSLLTELFSTSVDENIAQLADAESYRKSFNLLSCDIIDHGRLTDVICACLVIVRQYLPDQFNGVVKAEKMVHCALKGCWRAMRTLDHEYVNYDQLLIVIECHRFLKEFPSSFWASQQWDQPVRTVKTLLFWITESKGAAMRELVRQIPNVEESEVENYVAKILNNVKSSKIPQKSSNNIPGRDRFGMSKTHTETVEDLALKYKTGNPKDACFKFLRFKLANPGVDSSKFITVLEPHIARWVKNVIDNPQYENSRERIRRWPKDKPFCEEGEPKSIEHYRELSQKMNETARRWEMEIISRQGSTDASKLSNLGEILDTKLTANGNTAQSTNRGPLVNKSSAITNNGPLLAKSSDFESSQISEESRRLKGENNASIPSSKKSTGGASSTSMSKDVDEFRKRLEMIKNRSNANS
ncbi:cytoskeleton-associated protein 5-like [Convolutriloba macropyga]|uniref:cytoskeleton-associated protein 5-like n=1 Tax=Convolutriloba macropyga TaxID=536237 RepID=UPI003F52139C